MSKAVDSLLKFLSTASQEELDENFKDLEKYCTVVLSLKIILRGN